MTTDLQPALEFVELEDALALLKKLNSFADIIEVGTPTLIRYGVEAVRRIKQAYPRKPVLADLKTIDAGEGEARLGFEAGTKHCALNHPPQPKEAIHPLQCQFFGLRTRRSNPPGDFETPPSIVVVIDGWWDV